MAGHIVKGVGKDPHPRIRLIGGRELDPRRNEHLLLYLLQYIYVRITLGSTPPAGSAGKSLEGKSTTGHGCWHKGVAKNPPPMVRNLYATVY